MSKLETLYINPNSLDFQETVDALVKQHEGDGQDYSRDEVAAAVLTYLEKVVFKHILQNPSHYFGGPYDPFSQVYVDALREGRNTARLLAGDNHD